MGRGGYIERREFGSNLYWGITLHRRVIGNRGHAPVWIPVCHAWHGGSRCACLDFHSQVLIVCSLKNVSLER